MFSCYRCTPEIKLNIKWQMAFLAKKINLDMTDGMIMLSVLHWVENFKPCNKHLCLFARHLGLVTRKIPVVDLKSRLDSVWHHQSTADFEQLVTENSAWFVEPMLATLFEKLAAFYLLYWDNLLLLLLVVCWDNLLLLLLVVGWNNLLLLLLVVGWDDLL